MAAVSPPGQCPFRETRHPAGVVLLAQGERPARVFYLRRGQVALRALAASGEDAALAVRGPGSVLGIEALLDQVLPFEVATLTEVELCAIEMEVARSWVGSLASPLGVILEITLREASTRAAERSALAGDAKSRVARFLVEGHPSEARDGARPIPKRVIARALGMRPETLSRALAELRAAGALAPGRAVEVESLALLRRLAHGE